jgi:subtilisin family serine protease
MQKNRRLAFYLTLFTLLALLSQPLAVVQGFPGIFSVEGTSILGHSGSSEELASPKLTGASQVSASSSAQYIVVMKSAMQVARNEQGIERAVVASGGRVKTFYTSAINGFAAELPPAALKKLQADPNVAFIEPDSIASISGDWTAANQVDAFGAQSDPVWGLDRIDQRELPLDQTFTYDNTATDVHAYVVDTGILASHEDFGGRVGPGFTAYSDEHGTSDCHGHGTHVAGTIAGSTYGVAKGVTLHPVRVLFCDGRGEYSDVIAGLEWILTNGQSPGVVNMSLGGPISTSLDQAVNNVIAAGFAVVIAAGNSGDDACNYSPARVADAITVGATDSSDNRASFSNIGTCLDLFAPGVFIQSAYYTSDTISAYLSGTSMAAPHVSGGAALYLQDNPSASPQHVGQFITEIASIGRINGPGSGSPNRLLYVNLGPIPLQPRGIEFNDLPLFEWAKVAEVAQYQLELYDGTSNALLETGVFASDVCGPITCSVDPGFFLDTEVGQYGWRARVYDEEPFGGWTEMLYFDYAEAQNVYLPLIIGD